MLTGILGGVLAGCHAGEVTATDQKSKVDEMNKVSEGPDRAKYQRGN